MISIDVIIAVLFVHWTFDFVYQTDKQAKGKSTSVVWLGKHIATYSIGLVFMAALFFPMFCYIWAAIAWVLVNILAHFFTDYVTSRISSRLWKDSKTHEFFVCIGLDQMIHYITLFGTLAYYTA